MSISKLSVKNFKSFMGEYEVELKPLTAVMCRLEYSKVDFISAINFIVDAVGSSDVDPSYFYDDLLKDEARETGALPELFVKVQITVSDGNSITLSRCIHDGMFSYFADQNEVPYSEFIEILQELGFSGMGNLSNSIFGAELRQKVMWQDDGVEEVICHLLDLVPLLPGIVSKKMAVDLLKVSQALLTTKAKDLSRICENVDEAVSEFECIRQKQDARWRELLQLINADIEDVSLSIDDNNSISSDVPCELESLENLDAQQVAISLNKQEVLVEEAELSARLYNKFVTLKKVYQGTTVEDYYNQVFFEHNVSLGKLEESRQQFEELWRENSTLLGNLYADLENYRISLLTPRISPYGRVCEIIRAGPYAWIFKLVLEDLWDAHIFKTQASAIPYIAVLAEKQYDSREIFLCLDQFSPDLHKILFDQGEDGIEVRDIHDVMTTIIKLKEYGVISDIPMFIRQGGITDEAFEHESMVVFLETREFVKPGSGFGVVVEDPSTLYSDELLSNIRAAEERCEECIELLRENAETEILTKRRLTLAEEEKRVLTNIRPPRSGDRQQSDLELILNEIETIKEELQAVFRQMAELDSISWNITKASIQTLVKLLMPNLNVRKPYIIGLPLLNLKTLSNDLKLAEYSRILNKDDVENILGCKDLRDHLLTTIKKDLSQTRKVKLQSEKNLRSLIGSRLESLNSAVNYFNSTVRDKLQNLEAPQLDSANIAMEDMTNLEMFLVDMNGWHCAKQSTCRIARALTSIALFLSISTFLKKRFVILDHIDMEIPATAVDVTSALGYEEPISKQDFYKKIGKFLKSYLQPNFSEPEHLEQIIIFTESGIAAYTEAQVAIFRNVHVAPDGTTKFLSSMLNISTLTFN